MENNNHFNEQESLRLITQMINNTKSKFVKDGFYNLMWGYLVLAATVMQYLMLFVFKNYEYNYIGWPILMGIGAIVTVARSIKQGKRAQAKTYIDNFMIYLWSAFTISIMIFLFFTLKYNKMFTFPSIMVLYGLATFVSGGMLKFRPYIIGAILCWGLAIACFLVDGETQFILLAVSVVVAYIVPGHLMYLSKNN